MHSMEYSPHNYRVRREEGGGGKVWVGRMSEMAHNAWYRVLVRGTPTTAKRGASAAQRNTMHTYFGPRPTLSADAEAGGMHGMHVLPEGDTRQQQDQQLAQMEQHTGTFLPR